MHPSDWRNLGATIFSHLAAGSPPYDVNVSTSSMYHDYYCLHKDKDKDLKTSST